MLGFFEHDIYGTEDFDTYDNNFFDGNTRGRALNKLYMYFLDEGEKNASIYGNGNSRKTGSISRRFDKNLNLIITETSDDYKIGPFKIVSNVKTIPTSDIELYKINADNFRDIDCYTNNIKCINNKKRSNYCKIFIFGRRIYIRYC